MHGMAMDGETLEHLTEGRRGPVEGEHLIGHDRARTRPPEVPMRGPRPTPVFGTAQPLRGVSGVMRKAAYAIPEHYGRHWVLLMAADRVDVAEDRLGELLARPLRAAGAEPLARRIRANPAPYLAGAVAGAFVARRFTR